MNESIIFSYNYTPPDKKQTKTATGKYFVKAWWTDINDNKITEALLEDTVKFHLETTNIPDGQAIFISLYEDDRRIRLEEDKENDRINLVDASTGRSSLLQRVYGNKLVKTINLINLGSFVKNEPDGILELFFACSYKNEHQDLPHTPSDYLKVKGMPKIIFVNGHWNKIANKMGMSPGSGKKPYWIFFTGKFQKFKDSADKYFNFSSQSIEYFVDGSSLWGGSENGQERKNRGYKYAQDNFDEITKGLGGEPICIISHSEGGACASGIAKYLVENNINVKESILLSCDEGDEFSVEKNYESYQIVSGYLQNDFITKKSYFIIDPVVKDNKIKGVTRYGVYISNSNFSTAHGATVDESVFDLLKRLKLISIQKAWNSKGKIIYQVGPKDEDWVRVDEFVLYNSKVDYYPTKNSSIIELYEKRQY